MKPQNFNDLLALMYLPFVLVWVTMLALIYQFINVGALEFLGLGTATGVILSKFIDIYQFYFRKAPTPLNLTETDEQKINRLTAEIKALADKRTK